MKYAVPLDSDYTEISYPFGSLAQRCSELMGIYYISVRVEVFDQWLCFFL
jgi:hypothetical protein